MYALRSSNSPQSTKMAYVSVGKDDFCFEHCAASAPTALQGVHETAPDSEKKPSGHSRAETVCE